MNKCEVDIWATEFVNSLAISNRDISSETVAREECLYNLLSCYIGKINADKLSIFGVSLRREKRKSS